MILDRLSLKRKAIRTIHESNPKVINVAFLYLLLTIVLGYLSSKVLGINYTLSDAEAYMKNYMSGNYEYAYKYLDDIMPPVGSYAIDALLTLVNSVVGAGFILFLLNTIRNNTPCFGNLLDGFGFIFKIILLNILEAVFIGLWSLLLFFPGVVAYYRYSQAIYILIDDPSKSPMQCISESKSMMQGHKLELFKLDISLLGWHIAAAIPVIGYAVSVWTVPYIGMIKALFYEYLLGDNELQL